MTKRRNGIIIFLSLWIDVVVWLLLFGQILATVLPDAVAVTGGSLPRDNDYALTLGNLRRASMGIRRAAEQRHKNGAAQHAQQQMPTLNGTTNGGDDSGGDVADKQQRQQFDLLFTAVTAAAGPTPVPSPSLLSFDDEEMVAQVKQQEDDDVLHIHGMERPRHQQQQQQTDDGGVASTAPTSAATSAAVVAPIGDEDDEDDVLRMLPNHHHHQLQQQQQNSAQRHRDEAQSVLDDESSASTLCPADESPTFLRHLWLPEEPEGMSRTANFARKMDSLEACARLCRDNVEPFGGRHFACHGFTYIGQWNAARNACEFFDDHLAAALEKKPPLDKFHQRPGTNQYSSRTVATADIGPQFPKNYFERICLGLAPQCARLPFAFDVHPRRALAIPPEAMPLGVAQVDDRKQCLQQCLITKECRSLDFDTSNLTCTIYAHSLHTALGAPEESTWPLGQLVENVDMDHYENTCLTALDRCGTRHLAFILVRNAELVGFSVGLGKMSISECLSRCLDSPPAFCRAVQFRAPTNECFLGTERPFAPLPSDEMDIFEPVCLPDPPRTSILECHGEHVFERVPNMELRMDDSEDSLVGGSTEPNTPVELLHGTDMPGLTLEHCLDACILDESCVSLIFRPFSEEDDDGDKRRNGTGASGTLSMCRLFPFGKTDNRTLPVIHPNVDYFELSCNRMPLPSAMQKMLMMVPPTVTLPQAEFGGSTAAEKRRSSATQQRQKNMAMTTAPMPTMIIEGTKERTEEPKWTTTVGTANVRDANHNDSIGIATAEAPTEATATVKGEVPTPTHNVGDTTPMSSLVPASVESAPSIRTTEDRIFAGSMSSPPPPPPQQHQTTSGSAAAVVAVGGPPSSTHQQATVFTTIPVQLSSSSQQQQSECSTAAAPIPVHHHHSLLVGRSRTLKIGEPGGQQWHNQQHQQQRHHRGVPDLLHCERLCAETYDDHPRHHQALPLLVGTATIMAPPDAAGTGTSGPASAMMVGFRCRTFAYSRQSRDCVLLSSMTMINNSSSSRSGTPAEFELFSDQQQAMMTITGEQPPEFELYTLVRTTAQPVEEKTAANCGSKWSSPATTTGMPASTSATAKVLDRFDTDEQQQQQQQQGASPFGTNLIDDARLAAAETTTATITTTPRAMVQTTIDTDAMKEHNQTTVHQQQHQKQHRGSDEKVEAVAATQPPLDTAGALPTAKIVTILTASTATRRPSLASSDNTMTPIETLPKNNAGAGAIAAVARANNNDNNLSRGRGGLWMAPPAPAASAPVSVDGNVEQNVMPSSQLSNSFSTIGNGGRLSVEQIRAGVICDPQGYSGVVYAADRFAHCRLFVEEAAEFAFYVNRPGIGQSNWCNSIETNEELSVVLVMSNDEVFPLDVTTSDDLFFHVSCDYRSIGTPPIASGSGANGVPQRHRLSAWPGSVSGPEPGPLFASAARRSQKVAQLQQRRPLAEPESPPSNGVSQRRERVHLKILRDGRPVNSVYIGERLSAVVESNNVEVERLRVADCNASRVGGRVPRPSSIPLLDRSGCSLNPHIIGHMRRYANRLEAPLSAFRIDGSDQIDIVCAVLVCRSRCAATGGNENQCPAEHDHHQQHQQQQQQQINSDAIEGSSLRVRRASSGAIASGGEANGKIGTTLRKRLAADFPASVAGDFLTVDQRIRVLVSEEEEDEKQQRTLAIADAEAIDDAQRQLLSRGGNGGNALSASSAGGGITVGATTGGETIDNNNSNNILFGGMASTAASFQLHPFWLKQTNCLMLGGIPGENDRFGPPVRINWAPTSGRHTTGRQYNWAPHNWAPAQLGAVQLGAIASGDLCLNPVALLFLMGLLLVTVVSLIISLLAHWCHRKNGRRSSHNFYPATSTELSSHHFHIPRIVDRRASYMG